MNVLRSPKAIAIAVSEEAGATSAKVLRQMKSKERRERQGFKLVPSVTQELHGQ
jgi:hypothetical protein